MPKELLALLVCCLFFILVKIISISLTEFNLYGDEAQYWLWSKEISFGYFSKPPLLAWLIGLVTSIFGNSFVVLKSIPALIYCITSYLVFIFTKKLFNDSHLAYICALTFFLLPSVTLSSFLISTDVLLILFWTWSLIQLLIIKESPSYFNFMVFGLLLGLAFLAKYAALYFLISLALLLIVEKSFRQVFLKSKLKLATSLLIFLIILSPNILWNYINNWPTISHTADNASLDKISLSFIGLFSFLSSQIVMVGPVLCFGFLLCLNKITNIGTSEKFLICFALPALAIVLIESFLVRAHANWAAVSLVTLSIFFISVVYKYKRKILYMNNYLNLAVGFVLFAMIAANFPIGVFDRISGVKSFVQFLEDTNQKNFDNIVVSDRLLFANLKYEYHSKQLNFYSPHVPGNKISNHFQLKNALPKNFNNNFILVGNKDDISYLQKKIKIKLVDSRLFPFDNKKIKIYEVHIY